MLDQQEIVKLVEEQIRTKVQSEMESLLQDKSWTDVVESHLMRFAQDRVAAKFANAEFTPKILDTINDSVKRLFDNGQIDDFIGLVDEAKLNQMVDAKVSPVIDRYIEQRFNDPEWLDKVQSVSNHAAMDRVERKLTGMDIDAKLEQLIEQKLGNKIKSIEDHASSPQLTILDDCVVNENELVTNSLRVVESAVLQDLVVRGTVNTDNASWNELKSVITDEAVGIIKRDTVNHIKERVLESAKTDGIDFHHVKIDGNTLVDGNRLGNGIMHSRLVTVGELEELEVEGHTRLNDTLTVSKGKIGINTDSPATALDLRDDDVRITLGKKSRDTAQISTRNALEIATGNTAIVIEPDGKVKINELMIGRNNIAWASQVPNHAGQKGDIVFNMDPGADSPLGWQCLGSFRWRVIG